MTLPLRTALLGLLLAALAGAPPAVAARGGAKQQPAGLSLTYQMTQDTPNPAAPSWCLNEDDFHQRTWQGSLAGGFAATERLCDRTVDYSGGMFWDAGGIGLQVNLWVVGTLDGVAITAPTGESHPGVLVGSATSRGATTDHYQACFMPAYSLSSNTSGWPLPGGTWSIGLSGTLSSVRLTQTAGMLDASYQQANCPPSERNLTA